MIYESINDSGLIVRMCVMEHEWLISIQGN